MNNPLIYSDPSGEFWWFIAAAIIIGKIYYDGVQANGGETDISNWKAPDSFVVGYSYNTGSGNGGYIGLGWDSKPPSIIGYNQTGGWGVGTYNQGEGNLSYLKPTFDAVFNVPQEINDNYSTTLDPYEGAPEENFSGFIGGARYFLTGGNIGRYSYNSDGKAIAFAPISGDAPCPNFAKIGKVKDVMKLAKRLKKFRKSNTSVQRVIKRIDIPQIKDGAIPFNSRPHVHLQDKRAFYFDGTWRHGSGNIPRDVIKWINKLK